MNEGLLLCCAFILQTLQYDDKSYLRKDIPILEIRKLKEQNASLRAAVAQMRKEMESLDEQIQSSLPLTEQTITGLTTETLSLNPGNLVERAEGVVTQMYNCPACFFFFSSLR